MRVCAGFNWAAFWHGDEPWYLKKSGNVLPGWVTDIMNFIRTTLLHEIGVSFIEISEILILVIEQSHERPVLSLLMNRITASNLTKLHGCLPSISFLYILLGHALLLTNSLLSSFTISFNLTLSSRVLLEKLMVAHLIENFPAFYATRRSIRVSSRVHH
jgi:hypothetical protein